MTGRWRRRVGRLLVGLAVVVAALLLTDTGPQLGAVTALVLLVTTWIWLVVDLNEAAVRTERSTPRGAPPPGALNLRVTALRHDLAVARRDDRLPERLHARLVAVVDAELAAGHGLDRSVDPQAAGRVMGPELTRFVAGDEPPSARTTEGLARIVNQIERI